MSRLIGEMRNAGQSSYTASKAGVVGLIKSIKKGPGRWNLHFNMTAPWFV
jgi:3-oxoacyl-[acyl-carrier protein] reductase